MKADNTRNTFRPERHYRDVLKQQGRVDLDADWNEQQSIHAHRIETETLDVVGRTGAPIHAPGFAITSDGTTLRIGAGRYYVDGLLCTNERDHLDYRSQPDRPDVASVIEELQQAKAASGLVYLDVWLRHVTALDDPLLREVALGGPDTTTRIQVVWQVRVLPVSAPAADAATLAQLLARRVELQALLPALIASGGDVASAAQELANISRRISVLSATVGAGPLSCESRVEAWDRLTAPAAARLNARTAPTPPTTDLCALPPRAGYQRTENQLYRVEIHRGGDLSTATFKWSRDNGSVVTAIEDVRGQDVMVRHAGYDEVLGFAASQWVEIVDDASDLEGKPGLLRQIEQVPAGSRNLTLKTTPPAVEQRLRPKLRRWDQSGPEATTDGIAITGGWQALEDGVEIRFSDGPFRSGDYWLIPARVATGEVEWPPFEIPNLAPEPQPPRGVEHHYSRLAIIELTRDQVRIVADCRKLFRPLTEIRAPTNVPALHVKGTSWENDAPLAMAEFLEAGLQVDFDGQPEPHTVSARTVIVTLELPIVPETSFEAPGARETMPQLMVQLFGEITLRENTVRWLPVRSSLQALTNFFRGLRQVVGRVTLKGAAIWAPGRERLMYLDGRAVGRSARLPNSETMRTMLTFPTGSGERSSDFESWFFLTLPAAVALRAFTIAPERVRLMQRGNTFVFGSIETPGDNPVEVFGLVTLSAPAAADVIISLSVAVSGDFIAFPPSVTVRAGATSERFEIKVGRNLPDAAVVQVPITAVAGESQLPATLTILRRG